MPSSIFSDEWRDCLRAHYTHVVRMDDKGTEKTLRHVMIEAGFTESELKEMYVLATAHVDQVGADFMPDMEIFAEEAPVLVAVALPQDVIEAMVVEDALANDEQADAEADEETDIEEAVEEMTEEEPPPPDDPDVTQLSLF